jgi:hypothetical protein
MRSGCRPCRCGTCEGGGWRAEGGGWEGGGWRVEVGGGHGGGWRTAPSQIGEVTLPIEDGLGVEWPVQPARAEGMALADAGIRREHTSIERDDGLKERERLHSGALRPKDGEARWRAPCAEEVGGGRDAQPTGEACIVEGVARALRARERQVRAHCGAWGVWGDMPRAQRAVAAGYAGRTRCHRWKVAAATARRSVH